MSKPILFLVALASAVAAASGARAAVETYVIDPNHSSVGFSVRHFVSKVPGSFGKFQGTITLDRENLEKSTTAVTIQTASITTGNSDRDADLRSDNFFNVVKFPTMTFQSKSWKKTGPDKFDIAGDLTIKGITRPVVLKATLLGFGPGSGGAMLTGWEATTQVKKADFDLKGPAVLGAMLGEDVDITIGVEAGKR